MSCIDWGLVEPGDGHPCQPKLVAVFLCETNKLCIDKGRGPLGIPKCRWEDNIKVDLREVGLGVMDWIDLAQDRDRWQALVNVVMNHQVPSNAGNYLCSLGPVRLSGRPLLHGVSQSVILDVVHCCWVSVC